jgi:carboxysome shell carbonic anhydrase
MYKSRYREKSLFWKRITPRLSQSEAHTAQPEPLLLQRGQPADRTEFLASGRPANGHPLANQAQNAALRAYEERIKHSLDHVSPVIEQLSENTHRADFDAWAHGVVQKELGCQLPTHLLRKFDKKAAYAHCLFEQFKAFSKEFFERDPLQGQNKHQAEQMFRDAGFHAVGIAPCADGRLAHIMSYVLRLPYAVARRKAHAGALFDVSESVRHWVFIEHTRFRDGVPNSASEPTKYLKIAVYHFSGSDPHHQGCAAHGSDDAQAAAAAQQRLKDFRQAIENRFGCASTVQTLLIGLNTDDDSMKVHVPNEQGSVCLNRYLDTHTLYHDTGNMSVSAARAAIEEAIDQSNLASGSTAPQASMRDLVAWLIENNLSQIDYTHTYERGCYADIGHAERFIGIGSGFEEVQLRNLTYYAFLDTIEENTMDVDVGIKIFKGLNVKKGLPIPVVIRCDYDGRVPGSRDRAEERAIRIEKALHERHSELSASGDLHSLCTLRDYTSVKAIEVLTTDNA